MELRSFSACLASTTTVVVLAGSIDEEGDERGYE